MPRSEMEERHTVEGVIPDDGKSERHFFSEGTIILGILYNSAQEEYSVKPLLLNPLYKLLALCGLSLLVVVTACSAPAPTTTTIPPTDVPTQPAATFTSTATSTPQPTETPTETPTPSATLTLTPTETSIPTETLTPTPEGTATPTIAPVVPEVTVWGGEDRGYIYIGIKLSHVSPDTKFTFTIDYEFGKKTWTFDGKSDATGYHAEVYHPVKFNSNKQGPGYTGTYTIIIEGEDGFFSVQTLVISN